MGASLVWSALAESARRVLGLESELRLASLDSRHLAYLAYHRQKVFRA
jgi:hypothetical protein